MAVLTDPGDTKDTDAQGHALNDEQLKTGPQDDYRLSDSDQAKFDDISKNYDKDEAAESGSTSSSGGSGGSGSSSSKKSGSSNSTGTPGAKASTTPGASASSGSSGPSSKFGSAIRLKRNKAGNWALLAVLLAGILGGGFFSILPFKLESMMKNIIEKRVENRLKHYMAKREEAKVKKYVKDSVGESDAQFKANIANDDPATKDFEQEYRDAGAEKLLEEQDRIKLTRAGGTVNVWRDGAALGTIDDAGGLSATFDGFLKVAHGLQDMYRAPFRFMASKLWGIAKWAFFNKEEDPNKAQAEVVTQLVDDAAIQVAQGDLSTIDCTLGEGNCSTDEANPNANDRIVQTSPDTQASQTGDSQDSTVTGAVEQGTTDGTSKAKQYLSKLSYLNYLNPNHYIAVVVSKLVTKYISAEIVQIVSKAFSAAAGPLLIIAAVDIASRIDHFLWDGGADRLITNIHKIQYAAEFVEWGIIDDQWKSGQNVSGAEFNAMNGMLNGTENSAASRSIYGTGTGGQTLYETNQDPTHPDAAARSINEQTHPIEDEYKNVILPTIAGGVGGLNVVLANIPGIGIFYHFSNEVEAYAIHYLLQAWYDTLGHVWAFLQNLLSLPISAIMFALRHIPGIGSAIDWVTAHIGIILADLVKGLIKPAVDGTEVGADLMNGIDAGGAVAGMDFARTLGGHMLTPAQGATLNKTIADEHAQETAHMSLAYKLFSPDYAQSGVNLLALQLPSTPGGALNDSLSYAASIFTNPFEAFTPGLQALGFGKASADNLYDTQYGLNDWGFTDQDLQGNDTAALTQAYQTAAQRLNKPIAQVHLQELELQDCPLQPGEDTGGGAATADLCRLDIATMRASSAAFDNTDDGGLNSPW